MAIKLKDYIDSNPSIDEKRKVFYNMSKTMKYIHKKGYYIKTFNLNEIQILDINKLKPIQYNTLVKFNKTNEDEMKHIDVYNLAFLQIGIYSDMLNILKPEFLKEEFNNFIPLLPEEDVPYFRGMISRGANVYYSDYIDEKNKQEIIKLESEMNSGKKANNLKKSRTGAVEKSYVDYETKKLYTAIDKQEAAFVSFLIFPMAIIILGLVLAIMINFV